MSSFDTYISVETGQNLRRQKTSVIPSFFKFRILTVIYVRLFRALCSVVCVN